MSEGRRKTTTVQVSRPLDMAITRYATEHGITKSEAADRIFSVLYPDGKIPTGPPPIVPEEAGETGETEGIEGAFREPGESEEVSRELTGAVKDLRTVSTIRALQKGFDVPKEEEWTLTPREAYELKKIETMFGGGGSKKELNVSEALQSLEDRLLAQMKALMAERETGKVAEERDYYRNRLEEKEKAEARAEEMAVALEPIQAQMKILAEKIETVSTELKPESKTPPTSAELEAIRGLGTSIKDALVEIGKSKGAGKSEELGDYLDSLTTIIDKVNEFVKKGETPPGEFDWRTAAIGTFGEVTTEAIRAYREIESGKGEIEEGTEEEKPGLSKQVIERRVYNYAMKKIAAGDLTIDPYKAAEELALTPNQVWAAVESLRDRGALKAPQGKGRGRREGSEKTETPGAIEEGEIRPPEER